MTLVRPITLAPIVSRRVVSHSGIRLSTKNVRGHVRSVQKVCRRICFGIKLWCGKSGLTPVQFISIGPSTLGISSSPSPLIVPVCFMRNWEPLFSFITSGVRRFRASPSWSIRSSSIQCSNWSLWNEYHMRRIASMTPLMRRVGVMVGPRHCTPPSRLQAQFDLSWLEDSERNRHIRTLWLLQIDYAPLMNWVHSNSWEFGHHKEEGDIHKYYHTKPSRLTWYKSSICGLFEQELKWRHDAKSHAQLLRA